MAHNLGIIILIGVMTGLVAAVFLDTLLKIKDTLQRIESIMKGK